jgi:hypothetical protein
MGPTLPSFHAASILQLAKNTSESLLLKLKQKRVLSIEIPMTHNSVVVFSVGTSTRRFQHNIVLDTSTNPPDIEWIGMTFRLSKTCVRHSENAQAYLEGGTPLVVVDDYKRKEFFRLRRCDNQGVDFRYPKLAHTISPSDLLIPEDSVPGEAP